jgi:hypothetical protein
MKNNKLPYIFILDLDNTIIGYANIYAQEATILDFIFKYCKINNIIGNCKKKIDIIDELNEGLLRPYFSDFINFIKKKYIDVEIFVYSKGSYTYIYGGIIENIEKISKIKFNKPYFTRNDSTNGYKLLGNIIDEIFIQLIKKYPLLKIDENKKKVLDTQFVFIDDIPENLKDYKDKQIVCPEYKYTPYYNIKEKIISKYNVDPSVFDNKDILDFFEEYDIPIYNQNGSIKQKDMEYFNLHQIQNIRHNELLSNETLNDTFFKDLISILNKNKKSIRKFDKIADINKELNDLKISIANP